jgi:ribonuclease BN (tRNA processing enzyme)
MFKVKFYGVRGSYSTSRRDVVEYGGNTSCAALLKTNKAGALVPLVIDSGNGVIRLGREIAAGIKNGTGTSAWTMLWTHLHLDHLEGFPFFAPIFMPNARIFLCGPDDEGFSLCDGLKKIMGAPIFPVEFDSLPAKRVFFHPKEACFFITQDGEPVESCENPLFKVELFVTSAALHPNRALYYRITDPDDGASLVWLCDLEVPSPENPAFDEYSALLKFAEGANLLVHDTMYSNEEYATLPVKGFGHSTYGMALESAAQSHAKQLAAIHYNH